MRRFKKKPELTFVVIPGTGRINNDRVLEGDQFAKFCPSLLVELPPEGNPNKATPPPVLIPAPPVPPPAPTPPAPDPLVDTVETPIHIPPEAIPPKSAPKFSKNEAFPTPEELEKAVADENKQTDAQIDQAVERLSPVEEKKAPKPPPKPSGKKSNRR